MTESPKAAPRRIYVVTESASPIPTSAWLVRAVSPAQALRHVTRTRFAVEIPTQDDLVALISSGIAVENADGASLGT